MSKNKSGGFSKIIYSIGSIALVVMLGFSVYNFSRDARILELPVLSREAVQKDTTSTEPGDYKTIKYQKPTEKSKSTAKPTAKPAKSPVPTPTPTPKVIPSSDP